MVNVVVSIDLREYEETRPHSYIKLKSLKMFTQSHTVTAWFPSPPDPSLNTGGGVFQQPQERGAIIAVSQ